MKGFADRIRDLGLKPGLWWTPTVQLHSKLYQDHPDWFLRDMSGGPYRIGGVNGALDLTNPAALGYLDRTLAVILGEWGMDACKMDFWSQGFEDRDGRVQTHNRTAIHTRRLLFETIRKHLPDDGVFMTCVAVGMGNPFIGEFADTYRCTIDIGSGGWSEQRWNSYWALPVLGLEGRKTLLHNPDSVGVNLNCPDNENWLRLTWIWIIMGMQEIGGQLEKLPDNWARAMRKFTDRCDRGHRCICPDERAWRGEPYPEVLYVTYPDDSRTRQLGITQNVALFNWSDEPRIVSVRRDTLGQTDPVQVVDFWTETEETWTDEFVSKRLDGRSAVLFDVLG